MKIEFERIQTPANFINVKRISHSVDVGILNEEDINLYLKEFEKAFRENWKKRNKQLEVK